MRPIRVLMALVGGTVVTGNPACAQALGQWIAVDIAVDSIHVTGDAVRLSYTIGNRPESVEELFFFSVDVPQGTLSIGAPGDPTDWVLGKAYRGKTVASWGIVGEQLKPGQTVSGLWYSANGVLEVAEASIGGYVPPQPLPTESELAANPSLGTDFDPRVARAIRVAVPAIVPAPSGGSSGLLSLIQGQLSSGCQASGGKVTGICRSLTTKLDAVAASLGRGNLNSARGQLAAFLAELATPATADIARSSYWVLVGNGKVLQARLGQP